MNRMFHVTEIPQDHTFLAFFFSFLLYSLAKLAPTMVMGKARANTPVSAQAEAGGRQGRDEASVDSYAMDS